MDWTVLALCVGLALSPDLDFLPGILRGQPALYHQGISHSLAFGLVVSAVAALGLAWRGRPALVSFGVLFAAYTSHLLIDLFGPDARPPYGVPLFWPVDEGYYLAPFEVFRGVHHASSTAIRTDEWIDALFSWYNVKAIFVEGAVLAPLLLLGELRRRWRRQSRGTTAASKTR